MNKKITVLNVCDNTLHIKKLNELVYMYSCGRKTKAVCCKGNEYLIKRCLSDIAKKLPKENFFKIHNSFIINVAYIKRISMRERIVILFNDNDQIILQIAHRRLKEFLDFIYMRFNILESG